MNRGDLHSYQETMIDFAVEVPKCMWAVGMGLGKTVAAATAAQVLQDQFEAFNVLIVAPKRVAKNTWPKEYASWAHLDGEFEQLTLPLGAREKAVDSRKATHIINVDNLVWLIERFKNDWPYDMVILDESSLYKNRDTRRFKMLKRVLPKIRRLILLTGTPAPNGLLDLWSQVFLLDGGERLFRTFTAYRNHYFESDYMGYNWTPRPGAEAEIYARISDVCMHLSEEDHLELPERIDNIVEVEIPPTAMKQYRQLEKDSLLPLTEDDTIVAASAGVLVGKLLQFVAGALYLEDKSWEEVHNVKLKALEEIVTTSAGQPVLVAYNFKSDLARLQKAFPNAVVLDDDPETEDTWNRGEIELLLAHPQSAGHGLNLQHGGCLAVWFSLTWNLEHYQQMNKRLHRQGQKDTTVIHHIVARGTVDEDVLASLSGKDATQGRLLQALKRRAEELA